jgi:cytoskeletal protein CcmA (bactofilin family)
MAKYNENEISSNNINLIGNGTEITGDITCGGDLRIDGILTGNISAKGKIVVGETGRIKGEVSCKNSDISGVIEGKLTVAELLDLKSTSRVIGDITTSKLAIEPGSKFIGYCDMVETEKINEKRVVSTSIKDEKTSS